ncbi:DUF5333 family protein [Jannaschia formosa]|uniref:DUF5333 family protein n=1 Tax=Jannaschia formosa TaxID=2259592 RepID=UPI000E1BA334|nr:DUF5333 family protein [Jannaschia formosa]TFL20227.1 hypothetical protein DR046_02475 [Jannaschia formosa]
MRLAAILLLTALPAAAQELRPIPGYFVEAAMQTSTANVLAVHCGRLSVDPVAAAQLSDRVLSRLNEEGITPRILAEETEDPTAAIAALQDAFVAKHGLADGAPEEAVCAAGLAEIAEGTGIGALLVEVEE